MSNIYDMEGKKKVIFTEEQVEASKQSLHRGRNKWMSMIGKDSQAGLERSGKEE